MTALMRDEPVQRFMVRTEQDTYTRWRTNVGGSRRRQSIWYGEIDNINILYLISRRLRRSCIASTLSLFRNNTNNINNNNNNNSDIINILLSIHKMDIHFAPSRVHKNVIFKSRSNVGT